MKNSKSYITSTISILLMIGLLSTALISCNGTNNKQEKDTTESLRFPELPNNKVVAHRGGSMEISCPDNSIESLNYAIDLGCYASECDVYLTKDERVIVAHADKEGKINGLYPWEATYEEIKSAGLLENGEQIPTLEDYINRVLEAGTILLWIDVKSISSKLTDNALELASLCAEKASEIVKEMKADNFIEFIVPNVNIMNRTLAASDGRWECGLMSPKLSPDYYKENSYDWANFSVSAIFFHNGEIKGDYTIDDYVNNDIRVSVYNVDSEEDRAWYISNYDKLYALTTNYPKALLDAIN